MAKAERRTPATSEGGPSPEASNAPPEALVQLDTSGSGDPTPVPPENPVNDTPISFAEPEVQQTALIEDAPDEVVASHGLSDDEFARLHQAATAENEKEDFRARILEARRPKPEPEPVYPTPSPRMAEQTRAEMEAGRKLVEQRAAEEADRKGLPRPRDKSEGTNTEVFRPADFVPDPKKGQGNVKARTL